LVIVILALPVFAASPFNFLTKGLADTLYCPITGNCAGSGGQTHVWLDLTIFSENERLSDITVHSGNDYIIDQR